MNKIKCNKCGLINFKNAVICNRCGETLDDDANNNSDYQYINPVEDFTDENRKIGIFALIAGIIASIAPWILAFVFEFFTRSGKLNAALVVFGFPMIFLGLGAIISPPKSKLNADENKTRQCVLFLIGAVFGMFEVYFFNKALGFW